MAQNMEKIKKEQTTLKEVLTLLNDNIKGKDDVKILLKKYIYQNSKTIYIYEETIKDAEKAAKEEAEKKVLPQDENLVKYRQLEKEFLIARNNISKFFSEVGYDNDNFSPEQKIKCEELKKIESDISKKIEHLRENELNKPKVLKIGDKTYQVIQIYTGYRTGPRAIIVGETAKMYKLQLIGTSSLGLDHNQTSKYKYDYPTAITDNIIIKGKKSVSLIKMYDEDTYETLCS